jgi:hypothetical protein
MEAAVQVISHQTVKLSRGRHLTPDTGMCVMELASVLAGERFSDEPRCVCPVIAGLLRAYNDVVDDEHRRALVPYAAKVVGTRGTAELQRARAERCRAWGAEVAARAPWWQWGRRRMARRAPRFQGTGSVCGAWAVEVLSRPAWESQSELLALVDELIGMGGAGFAPRRRFTRQRQPELS